MRFLMFVAVSGRSVTFSTDVTLKRFRTSMHPHVSFQRTRLSERTTAHLARVRLRTGMDANMFVQIVLTTK